MKKGNLDEEFEFAPTKEELERNEREGIGLDGSEREISK